MKIIDQTPYLNELGDVSFTNQIKAALKFGYSWYPEIKAQKIVMDSLSRNLNKGYTLLRNITLPGSQATYPLILLGPAGIFVIFVTHLKGNYEAKGENWGVIEGNRVQSSGFNPLLLTAKMVKSLQRYFEKRGMAIPNMDGVLVATDPGMHIESVRPAVRVVLSDAIEHLAVTINNSSATLDSLTVQTIIRQLTEPKVVQPTATPVNTQVPPVEKKAVPVDQETAAVPEIGELLPWSGDNLGFDFNDETAQEQERAVGAETQARGGSAPENQKNQASSKGLHFDKKQWRLLIGFGVAEVLIVLIFIWIIAVNS